jgi:peptide/nickel transport system permease protein
MTRYIVRRLIQAIPLLIFIAVTTFVLTKMVGDPLQYLAADPRIRPEQQARLRALYGLDDPFPMQFLTWLIGDDWVQREVPVRTPDGSEATQIIYGERRGILRGDFGESLNVRKGTPVLELVGERLPPTLLLNVTALVVTLIIALAIGIYSALRPYTFFDNAVTSVSFIFTSMPIYLIALLSIWIFAVQLRLLHDSDPSFSWVPYLPVQGMRPTRGATGSLWEMVYHMILPVFCLSALSIAGYVRFIRASMLEVVNSDYIRTANAKGLSPTRVNMLHALKNAALPLVTLVGLNLPFLIAGAVVTERIFGWRGMGSLFIQALDPIDPPVLMIFVLLIAVAVVVMQLVTDVVYAWLDPRVRFS